MWILMPVLSLLGGVNLILFIVTIVFTILNLTFYVAPQNLKMMIMKQRALLVYLPSLILVGITIWDFIDMLINVKVFSIVSFILQCICVVQGASFALLVARVGKSNPSLLG